MIKDNIQLDTSRLNKFYQAHLELFEPTTDAPLDFIFCGLLPALGGAISMNRWIPWGSKKIYPNIWLVLVAPSTNMRKTTSLNIGLSFLKILGPELGRWLILPNDGSIAGLIPVLRDEKHGVLMYSEFATMLENMGKGFNNNMKSLFTDFFDVPQRHEIVLAGDTFEVENPIFSISSATTINWFRQKTTANDVESGFLARFLFCYKGMKTKSLPIPRQPDSAKLNEMTRAFHKILTLEKSEISFDSGFEKVFTDHYNAIDGIHKDPLMDNGTKAMIGRLQTDYILKFSILECVLSGTTVANEEIAIRARYLVEYFVQQAFQVMHATRRTQRSKREEIVLQYLSQNDGATRTDLYNLFNRNIHANDLDPILSELLKADLIVEKRRNTARTYHLLENRSLTNEHLIAGQQISPEFVNSCQQLQVDENDTDE